MSKPLLMLMPSAYAHLPKKKKKIMHIVAIIAKQFEEANMFIW